MSSLSSFDDLLSELDGPSAAPGQDREDPLRTSCLKQLVELSTRLEKVAQILDPSESKHPLFKQTIPAEQRAHLKQLVGELMRVQGELQKIEESLLSENTPPSLDTLSETSAKAALDEPILQKHQDTPAPPQQTAVSETESAPPISVMHPIDSVATPVEPPAQQEPVKTVQPSPFVEPAAPKHTSAAKDASLEKERQEFAAYKAQWEAAFEQDPSLRAAHPEVAAYYEQMNAYFQEKEQHLNGSEALDTTA